MRNAVRKTSDRASRSGCMSLFDSPHLIRAAVRILKAKRKAIVKAESARPARAWGKGLPRPQQPT